MRDHVFMSNKELMTDLKESGYIKSDFIFDIMCSVDRKNFTTDDCTAYMDKPQLVAYGKPIAAPHMHAIVLEQISENLRQGSRALDIGSSSGYLTICMALALGEKGSVIGIDSMPGFQNMANKIAESHYPELIKDSRVDFIVWDGRRGWPWNGPYDVIHVGAAAADVPQTLIEQLAPGGILIMPVGSRADQMLVSIKKSLTGTVQKTDLMKVKYVYLDNVDLPWSNPVTNNSIPDHDVKNMDELLTRQPENSITNGITLNEKKVKSDEGFQLAANQDDDLSSNSLSKSEEIMTTNNVPISKSLSDNSQNTKNGTKEVLEKIGIFESKMECDKKLKSYEFGLRLHCSLPTITGSKEQAKCVPEKIDFYEKNINNFEIAKSQENIVSKSDLISIEDSNKRSSGDIAEDAQSLYEEYGSNRIKRLDQPNPNTNNINQFSKLIKDNNDKLLSKSLSSLSTIASNKNKTQTVREKIKIYENLEKCKVSRSQENILSKINLVPKEEHAAIENLLNTTQISCATGESTNEVLETAVGPVLVNQEIHNANQFFTESPKHIMQTNEFVSTLQLNLKNNRTEKQTEQVKSQFDEVTAGKCQNTIQKNLNVDEKKPNQTAEENYRKIKESEKNRSTISSEFKVFKNEIKVMLDNFLSSEKENHEEVKLREVNLNINKVKQIQLVSNHDSQQECNCKNLEQTDKSCEKLEALASNNISSREEQGHINSQSYGQLQNMSELIEKLQTQYEQLTEKNISDNEELQKCVAESQSLEIRLNHLERKFKIVAKILAKLIAKINCHEKVLQLQVAVTEKEKEYKILEKQESEQAEETIDEQSNTHNSISESLFLPELNLMKSLLYLGKEHYLDENKLSLNNESEFTDIDENEMSLLKLILEE